MLIFHYVLPNNIYTDNDDECDICVCVCAFQFHTNQRERERACICHNHSETLGYVTNRNKSINYPLNFFSHKKNQFQSLAHRRLLQLLFLSFNKTEKKVSFIFNTKKCKKIAWWMVVEEINWTLFSKKSFFQSAVIEIRQIICVCHTAKLSFWFKHNFKWEKSLQCQENLSWKIFRELTWKFIFSQIFY